MIDFTNIDTLRAAAHQQNLYSTSALIIREWACKSNASGDT